MRTAALGLVFFAVGISPTVVQGQIVLKPSGSEAATLRPKTLDLDVTIRKGVAESKFDYVFANEGQWRGEADFLIALPENGVVTGFSYWYEGEKVVARVTEKERARDIYKAITTRQRDPALIEMVGKRTFRVKVFPVEANADLRVELKMVQALPSSPNGSRLAVPLKRLGKLETIDVNLTGDWPLGSTQLPGRPERSRHYRAENVTTPDLQVTAVRPKRPYVADLRAARSGGTSGFFALTLTAARGMQRPRLSFAGVTVKDVMGLPARMTPGKAYVVKGRYENVRPGARLFLAGSAGARFSQALDFSSAPEPNGPAAKLWAWAKIGRSTSRKEIIALSVRHTVPSRFTSWIAIPTEERKRFAHEIAMGDLRRSGRQMISAFRRSGALSAAGQRAIQVYRTKAKSLGLNPSEVWSDEMSAYGAGLENRWNAAVSSHGQNSALARRAYRELEALQGLGYETYIVSNYNDRVATSLASRVFQDRVAGRKDAAARAREAQFERAARLSGRASQEYVGQVGDARARKLGREVAEREMDGKPTAAEKARLARYERAIGHSNGGVYLIQGRATISLARASAVAKRIVAEMKASEPNYDRIRTLAAKRRAYLPAIEAAGRGHTDVKDHTDFGQPYTELAERLSTGTATPQQIAVERERARKLDEILQERLSEDLEASLVRQASEHDGQIREKELAARRDQKAITELKARLERIKAVLPAEADYTGYAGHRWWMPNTEERDAYVEARHEGRDGKEALDRLRTQDRTFRSPEYAERRADLLQMLTELDRLDLRPLSAGESQAKAELERKARELSARMGDPIVTFEAPADAIGMTVVMPDGTRLPMVWVARFQRWEARFDISAGTPDGPFAVRIDGSYNDGRRVLGRAEFRVDSKAPSISVERDGTILVLKTDEDVVRAVAFGPDGSRREMIRRAPGQFALKDVPAGEVRVVATDRAHNRSDMAPAEPLAQAESINPAFNVQALAPFGGRLWVSTLDAGGRFQDGETVPEVGPWPRQAVVSGGTLAVRAATGEVHLFDGRTWSLPERDASTLAADSETLLVGIVGGWVERSGSDRRVVRPRDLAGRVVTCLLADGDRLWIGTQGRGVYEWHRKAEVGVWHDERHGLTDDWITALGRDGEGRITVGTFVGGALRWQAGRWNVLTGTEGACVTAIAGDVVATRSGLVRDGRLIEAGEAQAIEGSSSSPRVGWRGRIGRQP